MISFKNLILVDGANNSAMDIFNTKLKSLVNQSIGWIAGIGLTLVVLWGIYIGVKFLAAKKAEQRVEAKKLLKQFILGSILIVVLAVGAPLLIQSLLAWFNASNMM